MKWIIPANIKLYDVESAFNELKEIDWKQGRNKFEVGDIVYIYCTKPYGKIMFKTKVEKINIGIREIIDDSKFFKEEHHPKESMKWFRLKLVEKNDKEALDFEKLRKHGMKGNVQSPIKVKDRNLEEYIEKNFRSTSFEKEVISIPAGDTIELIEKYKIHAHPDNKNYAYKTTKYYTFRKKKGIMEKIYLLKNSINFNPKEIESLESTNLSLKEKEEIKNYVTERNKKFKFDYDGKYKFYILEEGFKLDEPVLLPRRYNQAYFTLNEMLSGKEKKEKKEQRETDKFELNYKEVNLEELKNKEFTEGDIQFKLIKIIKRNREIRRLKLYEAKLEYGKVACEICGEDDEVVLEVHHNRIQVSEMKENNSTKLEDLKIVCANCHKKIHAKKVHFT